MTKVVGKPRELIPIDAHRLIPLDVMRGIVIVLMAIDHASGIFNADRYATDSAAFYQAGSVIPAAQFLVRWVTHLCAPTFLFLAGWSLALSIESRRAAGISEGRIDLYLLKRGLFILLLDPIWMSFGFGYGVVFQVLYAIGGSLCFMILLRRLQMRHLLALGIMLIVFSEALAGLATQFGTQDSPGTIATFLFTGGRFGSLAYVLYPLIPWLAYMVLGWATGRLIADRPVTRPALLFGRISFLAFVVFIVVRGLNGYGNMLLYRDDGSLLQWLHVSKYPPSLTFATLELSIMFLCLAVLFSYYQNKSASVWNPLTVYGQTPLFFYVLHVHLMAAAAWVLDLRREGGLTETLLATLAVLIFLYPACLWFRQVKLRNKNSLLQYL